MKIFQRLRAFGKSLGEYPAKSFSFDIILRITFSGKYSPSLTGAMSLRIKSSLQLSKKDSDLFDNYFSFLIFKNLHYKYLDK